MGGPGLIGSVRAGLGDQLGVSDPAAGLMSSGCCCYKLCVQSLDGQDGPLLLHQHQQQQQQWQQAFCAYCACVTELPTQQRLLEG
jgi:hypothetical protein